MPDVLPCPHGHPFQTGAHRGGTTDCTLCKVPGLCDACPPGGRRVSVRNSARARQRAAELYGAPADVTGDSAQGGEARRLADYWQAQAAPLSWREQLAEPGEGLCRCGGPRYWTGAYTALICPACLIWARPPEALRRAAAYLERQARKHRGELAVRGGAEVEVPTAEARAQRQRLDAKKREATDGVSQLLTLCDPQRFRRVQYQRAAREMRHWLSTYPGEIHDHADSIAELNEIFAELLAFMNGENGNTSTGGITYPELRAEAEREQAEAEQRQRAKEQQAEWKRQAAEDERQAAAAEREAERQRQAAARAGQQRQAAEARTRAPARRQAPPPLPNNYGLALLAAEIKASADRHAQAIAAKGACQFKHTFKTDGTVIAERVYGIGERQWNGSAALIPQAPQIRACRKHFAAAEQWLGAQGHPENAQFWWET